VYLERAVADKEPAGAAVWEHLGDALYRLNRVDEAISAWKKARKLGGENQLLDKKIQMHRIIEN
jgi:cytochrome c-type biogenesis protein CcmH/NrfG